MNDHKPFFLLKLAVCLALVLLNWDIVFADEPPPSPMQIQQWQNAASQGDTDAIAEIFRRKIEPSPELIQRLFKDAEDGKPAGINMYLIYYVNETCILDTQYNRGDAYYDGTGVQQDYTEAVKWYRKAAEKGHIYSQEMLGQCYAMGIGVDTNFPQAAMWFRKAAEQGFSVSQYNLGLSYEKGQGVIKDLQVAYGWYLLASAAGEEHATKSLIPIESKLSPPEQLAARTWAKNWKPSDERHMRYEQIAAAMNRAYEKQSSAKESSQPFYINRHFLWISLVLFVAIACPLIWFFASRSYRRRNNHSHSIIVESTYSSPTHKPSQISVSDDEPLDMQAKDFHNIPLVKMGMMKPLPDCEQISNASGLFGECLTNPIPVNGHIGTFAYLSRLRSKSGVGFMWHRLGSEQSQNYPHPIDIYELVAIDASEWRTLYFGIYHRRRSTMAPECLTLLPWSQMKDIEHLMAKSGFPGHNQKVENFPFGLPAIVENSELLNQIMPDLGKTMAQTAQKWINENKGKWGAAYKQSKG